MDTKKQPTKKEVKKPYKTQNITVSNNEKIGMISNMHTMLTAGIPILETVDSLLEDAKGNQQKFLETLRNDLMQGQPVHTSFAKFPRMFDKVTINIIKASEEAGTLDVTLDDLRTNIKRDIEFNDKIKSAFTYPIFIVVVFFGVMLMILTVVVPKLVIVFSRLNVTLPLPTKVMIFMSNALMKNPFVTIVVIIGSIVGIIFLLKTQRKHFLMLLTSLPLISNLARLVDLTRFTRSLYLLLSAGIPITSALELTKQVVSRKDIAKAIQHAYDSVSAGKPLSQSFRENKKVIPSIVIRITEAGEKSGSLDKAMLDASEFLDYQVTGTLKTVTSLIEPLMLVSVGGLVGGMMMAIIAPIYSIIGQVGPK